MFSFFYDYDYFCAQGMNGLLESAGEFFTPLFRAITFLGEIGWAFILASLMMLLFRRTRRAGVAAILAMAFGAVVTNLIVKNAVARPRPFHDEGSPFYAFWLAAGGLKVSEYSFPSGHATVTSAFAVVMVFAFDKRFSWTALFIPLVMGITRVYFQVHFASDVLFGYLAGSLSAVGAWFLTKFLSGKKPFDRFFGGSGIVDWIRARRKKREDPTEEESETKESE